MIWVAFVVACAMWALWVVIVRRNEAKQMLKRAEMSMAPHREPSSRLVPGQLQVHEEQ